MTKGLKKVLDIVSTIALVFFVIFVIMLAGVRLIGIEPHIVLSGSMEPEIMTGSLVYVNKISPEEARSLKAGDTVTYVVDKSGTKVTHRIY
jgi:signal peptidase